MKKAIIGHLVAHSYILSVCMLLNTSWVGLAGWLAIEFGIAILGASGVLVGIQGGDE